MARPRFMTYKGKRIDHQIKGAGSGSEVVLRENLYVCRGIEFDVRNLPGYLGAAAKGERATHAALIRDAIDSGRFLDIIGRLGNRLTAGYGGVFVV